MPAFAGMTTCGGSFHFKTHANLQTTKAPEGASRCRVLTPLIPGYFALSASGLVERDNHVQGGGSVTELP